MKRLNYNEKGITLVALVITIIILLILAGVTLTSALSSNGLFQRAKSAVEKYKEAEADESEKLNKIIEAMNGEGTTEEGDTEVTFKAVSGSNAEVSLNTELYIYKDGEMKNRVKTISINGQEAKTKLDAGTYYLTPKEVPENYHITSMLQFSVKKEQTNTVEIKLEDGKTLQLEEGIGDKIESVSNCTLLINQPEVEEYFEGFDIDVYKVAEYDKNTSKFKPTEDVKKLGFGDTMTLNTYYQYRTIANGIDSGALKTENKEHTGNEIEIGTSGLYFLVFEDFIGDIYTFSYIDYIYSPLFAYQDGSEFNKILYGLHVPAVDGDYEIGIEDYEASILGRQQNIDSRFEFTLGGCNMERISRSLEITTKVDNYNDKLKNSFVIYGIQGNEYIDDFTYSNLFASYITGESQSIKTDGIGVGQGVTVSALYVPPALTCTADEQYVDIGAVEENKLEMSYTCDGEQGDSVHSNLLGSHFKFNEYNANYSWNDITRQLDNIKYSQSYDEESKTLSTSLNLNKGNTYIRFKVFLPNGEQIYINGDEWVMDDTGFYCWTTPVQGNTLKLPDIVLPEDMPTMEEFNVYLVVETSDTQFVQ